MTSPLVPQALDPAPGQQVPVCPGCGQADRVVLWGYPTHPEQHDWWCNRCLGWLTHLPGVRLAAATEPAPKRARRKKGADA